MVKNHGKTARNKFLGNRLPTFVLLCYENMTAACLLGFVDKPHDVFENFVTFNL